MRQILLDYAKRKRAAKREGARNYIPLHELEDVLDGNGDASQALPEALIALDAALVRLEQHNPRQRSIVECRFFGGMTIEDTAEALVFSPSSNAIGLWPRRGCIVSSSTPFRILHERRAGPTLRAR